MGFKTLNQVDVTDGTVQLVDGTSSYIFFSRAIPYHQRHLVELYHSLTLPRCHSPFAFEEIEPRPRAAAIIGSKRPTTVATMEENAGVWSCLHVHVFEQLGWNW